MFARKPPVKVIDGIGGVAACLADESCDVSNPVKSDWIIAIIQEIADSGRFPYNSDIYRLAAQRLGLPEDQHDDNKENKNRTLSWLVYFNQEYRRHDILVAAGFEPLTQELVDRAYVEKKKIEFETQGILGNGYATLNPRKIGDQVYLMKPRARKYAVRIEGQPARIV